jgi:hypothetical protein
MQVAVVEENILAELPETAELEEEAILVLLGRMDL